ncbi:MAG: 30S ribosomal protein S17 [Anaerolineae bacterium]|nr:30S ribosomal protein S17 [Anaerolineae bacterium]MDQ7036440.1 30S ribosomal protein S17 [Anaerolineae bacterium]
MPNNRKRLVGRVVSDKMDKTVTVAIERRSMHPLYKKVVSSTKKVKAHDESNAAPLGAMVQLVESKPLSKTKRWVVEKVLGSTTEAQQAVMEEEISQRHEDHEAEGDDDTN